MFVSRIIPIMEWIGINDNNSESKAHNLKVICDWNFLDELSQERSDSETRREQENT